MNSIKSPQIISIVASSVPYTPFETLWIPNTARFVVLGENPRRTGTISVYQLDFTNNNNDENDEKKGNDNNNNHNKEPLNLRLKETKPSGFKCGTFGQSYNKQNESSQLLSTGDFNGTLNIWDLEKLNKPVFEVKNAHQKIINSIDGISGRYGAAELVTGSRDGTVKVWDPRTTKSVSEMRASQSDKGRDCWTVCFGNSYDPQNRMIAAGYDNGDVKILDLRTNKIYFETNVNNGVCCVEFDRKDIKLNKLVITSLESQYRIYDMKTKHISEGFSYLNIDSIGKNNTNNKSKKGTTIWQCRHLPQNRDIWITCLGNGCVNIWKYIYPDNRYIIDDKGYKKGIMGEVELLSNQTLSTLSTQPIVSWNWNKNKIGLACMAALDQTIQVVIVTKLNKF